LFSELILTKMTKFGIYTSFYKCEEYIERIFKNIESLNYDNFEWHVTDDFSPDNTKELVLERIKKSPISDKIKFYEQNEKKEMYWKPNVFFDASFDWIVLVDSDDEVDPNFLMVYHNVVSKRPDLGLLSSDFHKIYEDTKELHSISYLQQDEKISTKIERYHPSCDYLNNISYSCFGHLRAFNHKILDKFDITNPLACAEDSYHIFWSNSYGKYLNVPRPLYKWHLRKDSESHSQLPPNFNDNFEIALNKLKSSDYGVDDYYNDVYLETSTLMSYPWSELKNRKVSLWSRTLTNDQKSKLSDLYFDVDLLFNDTSADIHIFTLNFLSSEDLHHILSLTRGKVLLFYYQNQKFHFNNDNKDKELSYQLEYFKNIIGNYTGFGWWTYVRHFIIKN
jgi:glycosyltransferase involved in cell wall biosynthesis